MGGGVLGQSTGPASENIPLIIFLLEKKIFKEELKR